MRFFCDRPTKEDDDDDLLKRWRGGDDPSGARLIRKYLNIVFRYFIDKTPIEAEDLVQETLLRCVEGRDRLRRGASFRAYLLGIARNVLSGHLRSRDREERAFFKLGSSYVQPTECHSHTIARRQERQLLLTALRELPYGYRLALEQMYWQELRMVDVAVSLGTNASTVRSRVCKARRALRSKIQAHAQIH